MILNVKETESDIVIILNELKSIKVVNVLIMFLNSKKNSDKKIVIDLTANNSPTYSDISTSLSGIIKFYKNYGLNIEVKDKGYVSAIFLKNPIQLSLDGNVSDKSVFDKVIEFNETNVDVVADSIINQIKYLFICEKNFLPALSWCLKEIMDNVINHSGNESGLIMAQVHHNHRLVNISIFDSGIGLLRTLSQSGEYFPKNESEAIDLALTFKVSGNRSIGQGNGMWGLNQIVKNNNGHLSVMSGHTIKNFDYENKCMNEFNQLAVLGKNNYCTRVDFTLFFDNVIDIESSLGNNYKVYENINKDIENMENENDWIIFNVKKESLLGTGTRQSGRIVRNYLLNIMNTNEKRIVLDFKDVEMLSSSFADELVAKLILKLGRNVFEKRFVFSHVNEQCSIVISVAIDQRLDFHDQNILE